MKYIKLTKGHKTIVDNKDFKNLSKFKWYFHQGYARRRDFTIISMHRFLLNPPKNLYIDHINRNGLDNRRSNLRICTAVQNQANSKIRIDNTSGFKGVYWYKNRKKFCAQINKNKKRFTIGYFSSAQEASRAYKKTAIKLFGDFINLNGLKISKRNTGNSILGLAEPNILQIKSQK